MRVTEKKLKGQKQRQMKSIGETKVEEFI